MRLQKCSQKSFDLYIKKSNSMEEKLSKIMNLLLIKIWIYDVKTKTTFEKSNDSFEIFNANQQFFLVVEKE